MTPTGRFAPSPSGRMHLGNVYAALISWLSARSQGGRWLLRIEDIDRQRSKQHFTDLIMEDLEWLGLDWDGCCVQSERFGLYEEALARLREAGLTYPCYCTRAEIMATQAPHQSDGRIVYPGTCRPREIGAVRGEAAECGDAPASAVQQESGRAPATRLIVPDATVAYTDGVYGPQSANLQREVGDFVLRRGDGAWAYQLAVVVDDAATGVTEVVRGCDLLLSGIQQTYLHRLLGCEPPQFFHLPLLCNSAGQRLSKRDGSMALDVLRSRHSGEEVIGMLARLSGLRQTDEAVSARELIRDFSWTPLRRRARAGDVGVDC